MAPRVGQQEPSELSAEQRTSSELVETDPKAALDGDATRSRSIAGTLCRRERSTDSVLAAPPRHRLMPLSLDADQRSKPRDPSSQTGMLRGGHYGTDVLVRAGRLLGDAAGRGAADQNPFRREVVDDLAPAPALEGGVA